MGELMSSEGMGSAPIEAWSFGIYDVLAMHPDMDEPIMSRHSVPLEQFVHIMDPQGSCLCGPSIVLSPEHVVVQHYGLDERYTPNYRYGDEDEFSDEDWFEEED